MVTAFAARYPSWCRACRDAIDAGTQVTYVDDQLVHLDCASQQLYQAPRPQLDDVCDRCWTTRAANGTCACEDDQ